jgi:hypothetical protein
MADSDPPSAWTVSHTPELAPKSYNCPARAILTMVMSRDFPGKKTSLVRDGPTFWNGDRALK